MGFSFIDEKFIQYIKFLEQQIIQDQQNEDKEIVSWAESFYEIKFLFSENFLKKLENNLLECKKAARLNISGGFYNFDANYKIKSYEKLAVIITAYFKEFYLRLNEDTPHEVALLYWKVFKLRNDEEHQVIFDFIDNLPYLMCREILQNTQLIALKNFLKDKDFGVFSQYLIKSDESSKRIIEWESTFETKKKAVIDIEERLEKNKLTYDFVLLSKGFQQLYDQKKLELKERRDGYSQFAATLVCIPIAVIIGIVIIILTGYEAKLSSLWFLAFPITTLILFLFYFTRVGLQHVRSIQSQMMQLELRMALCQFIHNYAEDSEKLHKKNSAGFEKFENIIFSPLVSSDDKIPTTFDGMEQLAKMVDVFRKN